MRCLVTVLASFAITACSPKLTEFNPKDFTKSNLMFCQYDILEGSPLKANSFLLHHNPVNNLVNLGTFVYNNYRAEDKVAVGYIYGSVEAIETDNYLSFTLKRFDDPDNSKYYFIDRKTLKLIQSQQVLSCKLVDESKISSIKERLLEQHKVYLQKERTSNVI